MPRPPLNPRKNRKRSFREDEDDGSEERYLSNFLPHDINSCSKSSQDYLSNLWQCNSLKTKIMLTNCSGDLYSLDYQDSDYVTKKVNIPVLNLSRIWGTCNGLLCTMSQPYLNPSLYISNPTTRVYQKIPRAHKGDGPITYGFGYSPSGNDYEIVRISSSPKFNSLVDVYSLSKNSWRVVADIPYRILDPGVLVGSSIHWIMLDYETGNRMVVVAYDIGGESVSELPLPSIFLIPIWIETRIAEYKGKLGLFHTKSGSDTNFELWVMENYGSWRKMVVSIDKPVQVNDLLIWSTMDGIVLLKGKHEKLILYDLECKRRRAIQGAPKVSEVYQGLPYVESIVGVHLKRQT